MELRFYFWLIATTIFTNSFAQTIPNFDELGPSDATFISSTHGDTVRITPASPNNYNQVETQMFAMPGKGNGVTGVRFGLHGADGGKATYTELTGGPWVANGGSGGTIWFTIDLSQSNGLFNTSSSYGLPFFITYGKNGQNGTGYYQPCGGGGGGSTGMAWIKGGSSYSNYVGYPLSNNIIAIAAGGGGGEAINANLKSNGNGGGVTQSYLLPIQYNSSSCPPYSLQAAAGSSILGTADASGTGYDPCLWGTISESGSAFQSSTTQMVCIGCGSQTGGLALTSLTIGQPGGKACQWTGGPPPPNGNDVNVFNLGCGGNTLVNYGFNGGSGFSGGGASSEAFNNWVASGGGGTGTDRYGAPGSISFDVGSQSITPSYGGANYTGGYGYNFSVSNGGQTGNPASGWFEYVTIPDTIPPVIHVKNDTVYLDKFGHAHVSGSGVNLGCTDNDSIASITLSTSDFTCSNLGVNIVRVTATDFAGNSTSAWDTITVVNNQPPYLTTGLFFYVAPKYVDVGGGPYTVVKSDFPTFYDNCYDSSQLTYTWPPTTFTCAQTNSTQNVNVTVTAPNGKSTVFQQQYIIINTFSAQTIYVDSSATGANTGLSWQDAFTSLHDALTDVCTGNKTIYVAKGTYYPDHGTGVTLGDRDATFLIPGGDKIYGGFPSGGDVFDNRDPDTYPAVLSGAIGGDPFNTYSHHVVTVPTSSIKTYFEGITVSSGYAQGANIPDGGGVIITSSSTNFDTSATFYNCNFRENYAPRYGGAIFFSDTGATGSIEVQNCFFYHNIGVSNGGGVYVNGNAPLLTLADFTNCAFTNNRAGNGGALSFSNNASVISNCSFGGNYAGTYGGALYVAGNDPYVIVNNTIMYSDSGSTATSREIYQSPASVYVSYSDVEGSGGSNTWNNAVAINNGHNIDANPLYLVAQNLEIAPASPCRNAGLSSANTTPFDLNNSTRIVQDTIDMGAYEISNVVYVAWDAPNGGDGTSWATAFNQLQDGLNATYVQGYFKDVWVKKGTYYPTASLATGTNQGRQNTFAVGYSERIYGGFAGNEISFTQRNIPLNPTILSGDLGVSGNNSDNAFHVVTLTQVINPRLDGLIIQDGNADSTITPFEYGGGVYAVNGAATYPTPTLANCVFRNNNSNGGGGAVACVASTSFTYNMSFVQNLFYSNTTTSSGGAIFIYDNGGTGNNIKCNLYNCTVEGNKANISGAFASTKCAVLIGDTGTINLYNTIVNDSTTTANEFTVLAGHGVLNPYNSTVGGADPVFVNKSNPAGVDGLLMTADDGLALQKSSPYINGGNNAYLLTGVINDSITDITGNTRVQQHVVDMGAYEGFGCLGYTSLYVDNTVGSSGLGGSWGTAFKYLQDALNVANVCTEVDTIFIAQGTYYPSGTLNHTVSRDTAFFINKKLVVLGGYPNGGGVRNSATHKVILDGNINTTSQQDNAYHILNIVDLTTGDTVKLDGLTFQNGNANGSGNYIIPPVHPVSRGEGGAITMSGNVLVINNCNFASNFVGQGGGAIVGFFGQMIIMHSLFANNVANYGGAIRTELSASIQVYDNTFLQNVAANGGGAAISLYADNSPHPVYNIINNQFVQNRTLGDGGAVLIESGNTYIYNNTFYNNTCSGNGGALQFITGTTAGTVAIDNNIFYKNTAANGIDYHLGTNNMTLTLGNNSFSTTNPIFSNEFNLIGADNTWGTSDDGLQLKNTSPDINQGNNALVTVTTDITGAPRIQLGAVDLGAFEAISEITRWYVSVGQDSVTADGTSWATAFPKFNQGVSAAKTGDTVWVAKGIYSPASNTSFTMKSGVQIYGGFNATETDLTQRLLYYGYNSILQGNGSSVIINDSIDNLALLDGFVIQNGTAAVGAGMVNFHSSPQVRNCVFTNNSASIYGGGVSCGFSSPLFTNTVFYNNSVTGSIVDGGAMYVANSSSPVIRNCDFVNNTSSFYGGAIYCISNAHVSIANSAFTGNTATYGYSDNFFASGQNVSHSLMQTGNADSGNIISPDAGMFAVTAGPGLDNLWFTADDGLELTGFSNLVNRGINDSVAVSATTDITGGNARIKNGTVDIGAYESSIYNFCDSATFNSIHILYVDGSRPASGDGYSWKTAFLTLGEALDKANYCSAFDTILVAAGTYYPTGYQADTNRNLSFSILRSGYQVIGGYPQGGGVRNLGANNTILSGDIGVPDTNFDNSYHVIVFTNVDNTGGMDGFIITQGAANSPVGDANGNGGGAWIKGSGTAGYCKPRISNCVFTGNYAYYGGGVVIDGTYSGNSSPTFINCVFAKNTGEEQGGAMFNMGYYGTVAPVITNCTFAQNAAGLNGGGVYNICQPSGSVSATIKNTILWGNTSNDGLADQQFTGDGCTSAISYSIVQGGLSGSLTDGGHNLSQNPVFIDSSLLTGFNGMWMTGFDGLNIYAGSPAINAGNALGAPATDITGAARIGLPDIGAYENACGGSIYDTLNITACDSVLSPSHRYWWTTGGLHRDTTLTVSGCDTDFVVNLTLNHSTVAAISINACDSFVSPSGSYVWDTTGTYTDVISNAHGCDSVVTIHLTVNHATTSSISPVACGSYTSPDGHTTYTSSGVYSQTITNSVGCDSVITIHLTILQIAATSISHAVCNGSSYNFNGRVLTASGTYYDTLTAANGCDSIVTLNLSIGGLNNTATATGAVCTATQTGAVYQWLNCNTGAVITGATSRTYTATQNGDYKCVITLDNCTDTTNCVTVSELGIAANTGYHFNLYPNPNAGVFVIENDYPGLLKMQVVNTLGSTVKEFNLTLPLQQFDITELAAGVYQAYIVSDKEIVKVMKVVKQ